MAHEKPPYIGDVDALVASTDLSEVLAAYGRPTPNRDTSEYRMDCVFSEDCKESRYGQLTIKTDSPAKRIYCHSCNVKGNLLTLVWGLEHQRPPAGGKLRGSEFREAVQLLRSIVAVESETRSKAAALTSAPASSDPSEATVPHRNIPLRRSDNERARNLVTLHEQLITRVEVMAPAAARYFRDRPWLTPDVATRWKMGYFPKSAKGLMRGRIVYAYESEAGEILSYFGRDPEFDAKLIHWRKRDLDESKKPMKHRFVKGFRRGLELYGQNGRDRLRDERLQPSLNRTGLVVVEGPNDVIRLDCLDVAAVGLCSNRATDEQVAKIVRFARFVSDGKIVLMPDNDPEGETGCKELLWRLSQQADLSVRVIWSRESHDGRFDGRQPESVSAAEWDELMSSG